MVSNDSIGEMICKRAAALKVGRRRSGGLILAREAASC